MRKLIVSTNMTLDGFVAAPDGGLDWHFHYWDEEVATALNQQLMHADTLVLGRRTYEAMAAYWPARAVDLCSPREDDALVSMMNSYRKIVISKTLKAPMWHNTIHFDTVQALTAVKAGKGKDMLVLGSGTLAASLFTAGLVDEYHIWLHPIALGAGIQLFNAAAPFPLRLLQVNKVGNRLLQLVYAVNRD